MKGENEKKFKMPLSYRALLFYEVEAGNISLERERATYKQNKIIEIINNATEGDRTIKVNNVVGRRCGIKLHHMYDISRAS